MESDREVMQLNIEAWNFCMVDKTD